MNARRHTIDVTCDLRQVDEAVSCLFHTILLHRALPKFAWQPLPKQPTDIPGSTIGFEEVDCTTVDLTYVKCSSSALGQVMSGQVSSFARGLQRKPPPSAAVISLEFYEKRHRHRFLWGHDGVAWEIWVVKLTLESVVADGNWYTNRRRLATALSDKMLEIVAVLNRQQDYVPETPEVKEMGLVFDTSLSDVQPYLFRISHKTEMDPDEPLSEGIKVVKKMVCHALEI